MLAALFLVAASPLWAVSFIDEFATPVTANSSGGNFTITQTGLTDTIPGGIRRIDQVQNNGAFSFLTVGNGSFAGFNSGGSSSWYATYGAFVGGGNVGDLTTNGQDRFRLTVTNGNPVDTTGLFIVNIFNAAVQLVESESVIIASAAGVQTLDIPFSLFTIADLGNVVTLQLQVFGATTASNAIINVDRFEVFGGSAAIPEPASLALLTLGAALTATRRRSL